MDDQPRNRFSPFSREHSNITRKRFAEDISEYDPVFNWHNCVLRLVRATGNVYTYEQASIYLLKYYRYALESGLSGENACDMASYSAHKAIATSHLVTYPSFRNRLRR